MPEATFHKISDVTLESICDYAARMEDLPEEVAAGAANVEEDDIDISLSEGVLNINLGPNIGIWVINKQTPNRQIWWSSPVSGPRRYEYHSTNSNNTASAASDDDDDDFEIVRSWKYKLKSDDTASCGDANGEIDLLESLRSEVAAVTGIDISKL